MNGIQHARRGITRWRATAILLVLLPLASCSVFRPAPTHGGGKRFDEEQRLVSAAVSKTADRMNFSRIPRSKVSLEINSMDTSGGLQDLSSGNTERARAPVNQIHAGFQNLFGFRTSPWLQANSTLTNQDIFYLEESVKSRLRARKFQIVSPEESDVHVIVLVDCLGTNMSRNDAAVVYRDELKATCGITWYAVDSKTQEVISKAENLISSGTIDEWNLRFSPASWSKRSLNDLPSDKIYAQEILPVATGKRSMSPIAALLAKRKSPPPAGRPGFPSRGAPRGKHGANAGPDPDFEPLPPDIIDGMDPGVLPPLDPMDLNPEPPADGVPEKKGAGNGENAGQEDPAKMPMGDLIRSAWEKSRQKDVDGLRSAIQAIETKKPDAPALGKLKERLEQLEKKQP